MFILDKPYVSDFLKETIKSHNLPVLANSFSKRNLKDISESFVKEEQALENLNKQPIYPLMCPSENALEWIYSKVPDSSVAKNARLFKDKVLFRNHTHHLFPALYYSEISLNDLQETNPSQLPYPCVIKPAIGFFSLSVYILTNENDAKKMLADIELTYENIKTIYPENVLDTSRFIIEGYIDGAEYAFDAYFDDTGKPHVLGIFQHYFSSHEDVSDRLYITSPAIMHENLTSFTKFLEKISTGLSLRNFPMHVEVRVDAAGNILPVEINPLRFGGWCTTADLTWYAYGINPYLSYFRNNPPDWSSILARDEGYVYGLVVLNNATGIEGKDIHSFNYDKLIADYPFAFQIRKTDFSQYPLFGFMFLKIHKHEEQLLHPLLSSSLKEYLDQ